MRCGRGTPPARMRCKWRWRRSGTSTRISSSDPGGSWLNEDGTLRRSPWLEIIGDPVDLDCTDETLWVLAVHPSTGDPLAAVVGFDAERAWTLNVGA